jgi:hypothetical protein
MPALPQRARQQTVKENVTLAGLSGPNGRDPGLKNAAKRRSSTSGRSIYRIIFVLYFHTTTPEQPPA